MTEEGFSSSRLMTSFKNVLWNKMLRAAYTDFLGSTWSAGKVALPI
jgi:hypothetical protein